MEPFPIDPRTISGDQWSGFANLVWFLWLVVILNVTAGACMLLAHAVVPSFLHTVELPRSARGLRPIFTIIALVAFTGTIIILLMWLNTLGVSYDVYPKRLI